jgi:tetratricopeptide (TPR) repeat protein
MLRVFALMAITLGVFISPARAEVPVVVMDWKQAVLARIQLENQVPASRKLFLGQDPGDRAALLQTLNLLASQAPTPSTSGKNDGNHELQLAWVAVAQALALSTKTLSPQSDAAFEIAARMGQNHPGFLFEVARTLLQSGQSKGAKIWRSRLEKELLLQGYARVPAFAKVTLARARKELALGNHLQALENIDFAERLDPLSPWNASARLEVLTHGKAPWNWDLGAVAMTLVQIFHLMQYYHNSLPFLYNVLHWLRLAAQGMGLFLLLALSLRHFTRTTHLLAEKLPQIVEIPWRYLAIALAAISIWVAGVGCLFLAAPLIFVLWKAARPGERSLMRLALLGLLSLPLVLTLENTLLGAIDPKSGLNLYHDSFESGFDPLLVKRVESFHSETRMDQLYQNLGLSLQYRKLGNTTKAEEKVNQAAKLYPEHPFVRLQQGNLAMMLQNYTGAEKEYLAAMRVAPTWVETWFNASQAALFQNRSDAHKVRLEHAADADPSYLTLYLRENDEFFEVTPPARRAMDPMPRIEMALSPALAQITSLGFLQEEMGSGLLTVPAWALLALTLACILALVLSHRQNSQVFAGKSTFNCKICNKVMCRFCRKGVHCEACFKAVSGITDVRLRNELVLRLTSQTEVFQNTVYRSLNTLLPGFGDLYLGTGGMPLLWLLLSVASWAAMIQVGHPLMEYPVQSLGVFAYLPWIPLVGVYLVYNALTFLPGGKTFVVGTRREVEI